MNEELGELVYSVKRLFLAEEYEETERVAYLSKMMMMMMMMTFQLSQEAL